MQTTLRWHSKQEPKEQGEKRKKYVTTMARKKKISEAAFIRYCIDEQRDPIRSYLRETQGSRI